MHANLQMVWRDATKTVVCSWRHRWYCAGHCRHCVRQSHQRAHAERSAGRRRCADARTVYDYIAPVLRCSRTVLILPIHLIADTEEALLDAEEDSGTDVRSAAGGLTSAIVAGVFGGLVLAPMKFAPSDVEGLPYVGSMGPGKYCWIKTRKELTWCNAHAQHAGSSLSTGVLIAIFPITAVVMRLSHERWPSGDQTKVAAMYGTLSGLVWACGNAAAAIAISGGAGYSLAMPIMQSGLFVSGIWGISLFNEIDRRSQPVYWASGAVLIAGVALLASAK